MGVTPAQSGNRQPLDRLSKPAIHGRPRQQDSVMTDDASFSRTPGCAMQDGGSDQEECQQTFMDVLATGSGDQSSAKIVCLVY